MKMATLNGYPDGAEKAQVMFQSGLAGEMNFAKVAEAAGAYGEKLMDPTAASSAIARCVEQVRNGRTALLHACVTKH